MSLKALHVVFIIASSLLGAWFGIWCLNRYLESSEISYMYGGAGSLMASFGLLVYLGWMLKKLRNLGFLTLFLVASMLPRITLACSVCYGDPNAPLVKSANAGVGFFLGLVVVMLSGFGSVFLVWRRRARLYGE